MHISQIFIKSISRTPATLSSEHVEPISVSILQQSQYNLYEKKMGKAPEQSDEVMTSLLIMVSWKGYPSEQSFFFFSFKGSENYREQNQ